MSAHDDLFAATGSIVLASQFADADAVVYTTKAGAASTVDAIINRDPYPRERMENGDYLVKRAMLGIQTSDISEPDVDGDTVTLDGATWGIVAYTKSASWYLVEVLREELISKRARP